jgi:protoporphyrinogen oxidase
MKVAIIGAGMTGLSAAFDLTKAGHQVTIFEASNVLGGLAAGFREPRWDWSVEKFYHHWFASDVAIKQFQKELGLSGNVQFHQPQTVAYYNGSFHRLDTVSAIVAFPGFGITDTLRFGLVTAYLKYAAAWQSLEKVTASKWLQKYYGNHVYQILWQPLLQGKFGPYYQDANMAWMWARLKARTASLGTYEGGFQTFFDDIQGILERLGVSILRNTSVKLIDSHQEKVTITTNTSKNQFDKCVVTLSPQLFAKLAPRLPPSYLSKIKSLKSLGAVVLVLSLKKPLSDKGYYWYNLPKNEGFPFLALVEHTNFVSRHHFTGDHIVYCGDYCIPEHEYFSLTDNELLKRFIPGIKKVNPNFSKSWINKIWVFKAPYAQPVPEINHSKLIPEIKSPLNNVYFASMSHVYPWDRGTNFAVKLGREVAKQMITDNEANN